MTKEIAMVVAPLGAALIAVLVPAARGELRQHTDDIRRELDWPRSPDGYHRAREYNRAIAIYHNGVWAGVFFGGAILGLCFLVMGALTVVAIGRPGASLVLTGGITVVGLSLWLLSAPPLLRSLKHLCIAAYPATRSLRVAKIVGRGTLTFGSLLLILTPVGIHI